MELNCTTLRGYILEQLEHLSNEVGFQYGWLGHHESLYKLEALRRIVQKFGLGEDLDRDLADAIGRLKKYIHEHPECR